MPWNLDNDEFKSVSLKMNDRMLERTELDQEHTPGVPQSYQEQ